MVKYETLMLLRTEITGDELAIIEQQFEDLVAQASGSMVCFDKWGKYRLAYPVQKSDYGIYVLARYRVPQGALVLLAKELSLFFKIKCSDVVMRFVTVKLDDDVPIAYIKPEPVDSGGRKNLDMFIKENKMEGIIGTDVAASKTVKAKEISQAEQGTSE